MPRSKPPPPAAFARVPRIDAIAGAEYPTPARRPTNSRLDTTRAEVELGLDVPGLACRSCRHPRRMEIRMSYTPRNVLVTGGAGFIGANYVRWLLGEDAGVRIVSLDALTYAGSTDNLANCPVRERHTFVQGDICDAALVTHACCASTAIDTVVHFAARIARRSLDQRPRRVRAHQRRRHIHLARSLPPVLADRTASCRAPRPRAGGAFTISPPTRVYGTLGKDDPGVHRMHAVCAELPYSASKAGSDHLVRAYFHTYGLPVTTTNCSNNYGPLQHAEKFHPDRDPQLPGGRNIPVYGDGSNIRDWLYVEDHCRGIERVIRRGRLGETFRQHRWLQRVEEPRHRASDLPSAR